jgi:hypothetical protein
LLWEANHASSNPVNYFLTGSLVPLGFRSDNILRAIRALDRIHVLRLAEGRFAETSRVMHFRPVETPIPEDQILAILKSMR